MDQTVLVVGDVIVLQKGIGGIVVGEEGDDGGGEVAGVAGVARL